MKFKCFQSIVATAGMVATTHAAKLSHDNSDPLFAQTDIVLEQQSMEQLLAQVNTTSPIKNKLKTKLKKEQLKLATIKIVPIDKFKEKKKKEKAARRKRKNKVEAEDEVRDNPGFDPEEASDVSADENLGLDMEMAQVDEDELAALNAELGSIARVVANHEQNTKNNIRSSFANEDFATQLASTATET